MSPVWNEDHRIVDSPQNASVRRARALERDRALRERSRTYVAWGRHIAREALANRATIHQAFVGPRLMDTEEGRDILRLLSERGVPLLRVTTRVLESVVEGCGDQGVLLLAAHPQHDLARILEAPFSLVLAAHGVQDPGNIGSILRSARAFGASGFIALEGCADPFGSRAARAAMGTLFTLPVVAIPAARFLEVVRGTRFQLVATVPAGTESPDATDLVGPIVLMLGNEGAGLPRHLMERATRRVRIPMAPGVTSLNVHAAAAALLYEVARQRGFHFGPR